MSETLNSKLAIVMKIRLTITDPLKLLYLRRVYIGYTCIFLTSKFVLRAKFDKSLSDFLNIEN